MTEKLSTGSLSHLKKAEGKKRKSPSTPYREKGKGKEDKPGASSTGLFARADAHVTGRGASPPECIRPCLCPRRPERQDLARDGHLKAVVQLEAEKS